MMDSGFRPESPSGQWVRRLARWLELRAIGLTPEHLDMSDGLRSALIVGGPLLLVAAGHPEFGWAIFAAFWTCLADSGGTQAFRRRLLLSFAVLGSITAFFGSWLAGYGPVAGVAVGAFLVAINALLPLGSSISPLAAALLGVVGVVAAGYPHAAADALPLAGSFLIGSAWAVLVLTLLWRTDPWSPVRRSVAAVHARLADMAADLAAPQGHPSVGGPIWTFKSSQHRRAVRNSLERAKAHLARTSGPDDGAITAPLQAAILAADDVFHALLALDHLRSRDRQADISRLLTGAIRPCLLLAARDLAKGESRKAEIEASLAVIDRSIAGRRDAVAGAARRIAAALRWSENPAALDVSTYAAQALPARTILQGAVRSAVGVTFVTVAAHLFGLTYPYWAAMAVIVVLQPDRRMSWSRALERIVGSVAGSTLALAVLAVVGSPWLITAIVIPLSALTIALRSVSYTLFVTAVTLLFVLAMDMLHPGAGIASARMLDNVIGCLAAMLVTFAIWPERSPSISDLAVRAVEANRHYLAAVERGDEAEIAVARRAAGLASTQAEVAFHAPDRYLGKRPSPTDVEALAKARRLAGEAAVLWHSR
ncbi:FUSC family protein [Allorhizobium taibaishanense]|nr:FUSC family protein [Allorhizobium taibaishanense]MBB4009996.1 putative membrane protein YccC [Allorhizobium taibaishanense]